MNVLWNWFTVLVGVAVIVVTYINGALLADYFDAHAIFDNAGLSIAPSVALGVLGLVLIVGGVLSALFGRRAAR